MEKAKNGYAGVSERSSEDWRYIGYNTKMSREVDTATNTTGFLSSLAGKNINSITESRPIIWTAKFRLLAKKVDITLSGYFSERYEASIG